MPEKYKDIGVWDLLRNFGMYGLKELKERIKITETTIECPIKGCKKKFFKQDDKFKCSKHGIFISPSTFKYSVASDNLLWNGKTDKELLRNIKTVKRENRMEHNNSEDAVSWNVFRFLERNNLIEKYLSLITEVPIKSSEVIYWSYSQKENSNWNILNKAREEFGEVIKRSSEPDIIINTDKGLFFIEAKLTAGNKTVPSNKNNKEKYTTGGSNWFSKVFCSSYKKIAIQEKKYELLRFWLLGTWMANQLKKDFYLINLVLEGKEEDIEAIFKKHIKTNKRRKFMRITWEDIYKYIVKNNSSNKKEKGIIIDYFKNKTLGFRNGKLKNAFIIDQSQGEQKVVTGVKQQSKPCKKK